jgi:hypothetical protein
LDFALCTQPVSIRQTPRVQLSATTSWDQKDCDPPSPPLRRVSAADLLQRHVAFSLTHNRTITPTASSRRLDIILVISTRSPCYHALGHRSFTP